MTKKLVKIGQECNSIAALKSCAFGFLADPRGLHKCTMSDVLWSWVKWVFRFLGWCLMDQHSSAISVVKATSGF